MKELYQGIDDNTLLKLLGFDATNSLSSKKTDDIESKKDLLNRMYPGMYSE